MNDGLEIIWNGCLVAKLRKFSAYVQLLPKSAKREYSLVACGLSTRGQIRQLIYQDIRISEVHKNRGLSKATVNLNHNTGHDGLEAQQGGAGSESRPGHTCPD
jgi:hypothetical protein